MPMRTRRPAAALAIAGTLLVLAGCSGGSTATVSRSRPGSSLGTVTVLAASSLSGVFGTLGRRFEAEHPGSRVVLSFAASSELATQVAQGAPADVFASASPATMDQVSAYVVGPPVTFARNTLEIAVPAGNPGHVAGLADFADPSLTIALCAPQVPCGAAAAKVFAAAKVTPRPDTLEADVKATLAKVTLGEVDAALVYRTDVLAAGKRVQGIPFPEAAAAVNDYPVAVLKDAPDPKGAKAFVALVRSAEGRRVLTAAGFQLP